MAKNLREIKTQLAAAFPSVRFEYDTAGRGRFKGPRVSWTGGPNTTTVSQAAGWLRHKRGSVTLHFNRTPTPEELAAIEARQAQEHAEWLADAPNREARHKAQIAEKRRLGAAKAAVTRACKAEREAALASAPAWEDESEDAHRSIRFARKQTKRANKAARVRKAIARYPLALADAGCRRNHLSAQIALPLELPRRHTA
jgi:hypothetical protein